MANIFLTSSIGSVAHHLAKHINTDVKKFLFITTASEVEEGDQKWHRADRQSMVDAGYELENYTITDQTSEDVENKLAEVDGIIMEGGNTFYLIQQIQLTKTAEIFKKFVASGKTYIGSSAGSMVAGPSISISRDDGELAKAPNINGFDGLGITDLAVQPHWGLPDFRDVYLKDTVENMYIEAYKIILLTNNQYIIVDKENIKIIDITKD